MKAPPSTPHRKGFTLVEILVSLGIVSLLTALIFGATTKARSAAVRIEALSKFKQLGLAIQEFANDNNNYLPGPLWAVQTPWYTSDKRTLGCQLWNYIGAPVPQAWTQEAKALSPKGYEKARLTTGAPSILTQRTISGVDVWGYDDGQTSTPPVKMSMLTTLTGTTGLSKTWAAEDIDQTNPNANRSANWYNQLPTTPICEPFRIVLYFDWHVATESIN